VSHRKPVTPDDLKRIGLFGALSADVLDHLASSLPTLEPDAGDQVFSEGDTARELFVLLEGEVEVLKRSKSGIDARVAMLGPGDWFGEMGVLDVRPRSASVRALAPSRLLQIRTTDLDALYRYDLKAYALVVLNIARELSRRLRVTDSILADILVNVLDVVERRRPEPSDD